MTVISHPHYSPDLAPCDFFLLPRMKGQMKWKRFADVIEVRKRTLEALNISTEEFQKCFQQWEKNVGTSVSSQKESTLKEIRFVIVQNLKKLFKKIIPVIFGTPLYMHNFFFIFWYELCI